MSTNSLPAGGTHNASLSERVRSLRLNDRPTSGGGSGRYPWILCGILALTTVYFALEALAPPPAGTEPAPAAAQAAPKGTPAAALSPAGGASKSGVAPTPSVGDGGIVLENKGNIVPVHTIQVSPLVGGRVMELNFEEGQMVKEGFVLAKIEDVEYRSDYNRLAAMVEGSRARINVLNNFLPQELAQLDAELKDAQAVSAQMFSEYKRSIDLRGTRSLSARDFEQAESSYRSQEQKVRRLQLAIELMQTGTRQEQIKAAQADTKQIEAEATKAKWRFDNTTVVAPISGIILSKKAEKGNMVNPSAFSNGLSASLCEMADLGDMEVDLAISERDIGKLFKGQGCKVRAEAFPERDYRGVISRIMPQADRSRASVAVRVKVEIPPDEVGRYLRPEMGALVTFYNRKG